MATLVVNVPQVWQVVFAEDFETDATLTNWVLFQGSGNGISDYMADGSFRYGTNQYLFNGITNVIPPAPNSAAGTARGLKLTVNQNDAVAATAGVSLYPRGQSFSNNFAFRCDVWLNYNGPSGGGIGSTEYATFGINHAGTRVNWGAGTAGASDGVWFAMDGEGGASRDYRAYLGTNAVPPVPLSFTDSGFAANGARGDDAADPFFRNLFPAPAYETPGAPGKHWVQAEVSQLDGLLTWRLNGEVVAQRTNASPFLSGNIMLGYMDTFTSIANPAADNFVLFDNMRVLTVVEPPAVTVSPTNRTVNAGASATFAVGTSGTVPLSYQWRRNGTNVPGATNRLFTLSHVQFTDAGAYTATVTKRKSTETNHKLSMSLGSWNSQKSFIVF